MAWLVVFLGFSGMLFFGGGIQVSDVVQNGIPHTRDLTGFHPAPQKPSLTLAILREPTLFKLRLNKVKQKLNAAWMR
jgi:hypothetical protein